MNAKTKVIITTCVCASSIFLFGFMSGSLYSILTAKNIVEEKIEKILHERVRDKIDEYVSKKKVEVIERKNNQ